jgi:hypothetical protein
MTVQPAAAEVVVIGPAAGPYKIGDRLPDDPALDIPMCIGLTLHIGGKFQTFAGPYKGPLSKYKDPGVHCFVIGERLNVYDQFFHQICEKQNHCDTTCTAVFAQLPDKASMKLSCR